MLAGISEHTRNSGNKEFLDAGSVHHADGDGNYRRIRGRDHSCGKSRDRGAGASYPGRGRGAIATIALFSMLTSLISWGLSLIFSGLLTREMARHVKGMDYRAAGAASYLGLGATWALGLSSSAAMLMATRSAIPPALLAVSGVIPLRQTIVSVGEHRNGGGNNPVFPSPSRTSRLLRLQRRAPRRISGFPLRASVASMSLEPDPASGWSTARC